MIISNEVYATCSGRNKKHFEAAGYKLPYKKDKRGRLGVAKGSKILVKVSDLPAASQVLIEYSCDDCGVRKSVHACTFLHRKNSQYLKTGETVCSKCANKRMSGENNSQYLHGNNRFCEYRLNAKKRGLKFNLDVGQFESLVKQECHYCGGHSIEWDSRSRGNGIDRKDSDIGYEVENCVPCCSKCNFVKNSTPYDAFISYIKRISERF